MYIYKHGLGFYVAVLKGGMYATGRTRIAAMYSLFQRVMRGSESPTV